MTHTHASAGGYAQFSSLHSPEPSKSDACSLETTRLYQRAINGLTDALHVLNSSPITIADLQHALGRAMRGITAIERLKALHGAAPERYLYSGTSQKQATQERPSQSASSSGISLKHKRRRRFFDQSYKRKVVQFIRQQHLSFSRASRELGIANSVLRRWMYEFDAELSYDSSTAETAQSASERICALEHRLQQLQADNELLKKTSALFAREIYGSSVPGR